MANEDSTVVSSVEVEAVESSSSSGVGVVVVVVVGFGIVLSLLEEPPGRNLLRMPVVEEDLRNENN